MKLSASEGAPEIDPAGIPRMGEESRAALGAAYGAIDQIGAQLQRGLERPLILSDEAVDFRLLPPIFAAAANIRDGQGKTARFSVRMCSCCIILVLPSRRMRIESWGRGFFVWRLHRVAAQARLLGKERTTRPGGHLRKLY